MKKTINVKMSLIVNKHEIGVVIANIPKFISLEVEKYQ